MAATGLAPSNQGAARRLSELLPVREVPPRVRLRVALDVLGQLVQEGKSAVRPRAASSGARLENVHVSAEGQASLVGSAARDSGAVEIVWEILAGRPMPEEPAPRLRDVVDEIPTDVDELMERILGAGDAPPELEAFIEALEDASRDNVATHDEVRGSLDDDIEATQAIQESGVGPRGVAASAPPPSEESPATIPPRPRAASHPDLEPEPATVRIGPKKVRELRDAHLRAQAAPPPPKPAKVPRRLVVHFEGKRYAVGTEPFMIGRSKQATDLRIPDAAVTRHHALVEFVEGRYFITDLGSLNGVEFEGERIERRAIQSGDVYVICGYELRFSDE